MEDYDEDFSPIYAFPSLEYEGKFLSLSGENNEIKY